MFFLVCEFLRAKVDANCNLGVVAKIAKVTCEMCQVI